MLRIVITVLKGSNVMGQQNIDPVQTKPLQTILKSTHTPS
jgi:hypothetical protein